MHVCTSRPPSWGKTGEWGQSAAQGEAGGAGMHLVHPFGFEIELLTQRFRERALGARSAGDPGHGGMDARVPMARPPQGPSTASAGSGCPVGDKGRGGGCSCPNLPPFLPPAGILSSFGAAGLHQGSFSPLKLSFPNSTAISDGNTSHHESKECSNSWTHYLS